MGVSEFILEKDACCEFIAPFKYYSTNPFFPSPFAYFFFSRQLDSDYSDLTVLVVNKKYAPSMFPNPHKKQHEQRTQIFTRCLFFALRVYKPHSSDHSQRSMTSVRLQMAFGSNTAPEPSSLFSKFVIDERGPESG